MRKQSNPTNHRRFKSIRSVKFMYPSCQDRPDEGFQGCQSRHDRGVRWWEECIKRGHDPYYGTTKHTEVRPKLVEVCAVCEVAEEDHSKATPPQPPEGTEPVTPQRENFSDDEEFATAMGHYERLREPWDAYERATVEWSENSHEFTSSGKMRQDGVEEYIWYTERPNLKQVQVTPRVSGERYGLGPIKFARLNGYILPEEHPEKPQAPFCQYHDCFSADTEFVTREGVQRLGDAAGAMVEVLTEKGWAEAPISYFGEQEVFNITFAPVSRFGPNQSWGMGASKFRVTERATARHRWILVDGTVTQDLKVGDVVRAQANEESTFDSEGFIHGFVFGDGTLEYTLKGRFGDDYGRYGHRVTFYSDKDKGHLDLFRAHGWKERAPDARYDAPSLAKVCGVNLKDLPTAPTATYARGFLLGWCAADGSRRGTGWRLSSQHPEAEAWLRRYAAAAGFVLTGAHVGGSPVTNKGRRKNPLRQFLLTADERAWRVLSMESAGVEPTYCATVPEVEAFTLASGIYTGNCWSQNIKVRDARYGDYCRKDGLENVTMDMLEATISVDRNSRKDQIQKVLSN